MYRLQRTLIIDDDREWFVGKVFCVSYEGERFGADMVVANTAQRQSPRHIMQPMSFHELSYYPALLKRIDALGFREPTAIQSQVARPALAGRDLIGLAETGSGKTAAFALPTLHHLHNDPTLKLPDSSDGQPRALILCPTRELAQQVATVFDNLLRGTHLNTVCLFGGVGMQPQIQQLDAGVAVVVSTPGRALDLLDQGALELGQIKHLIIDEADRLMDMGFFPQVKRIADKLPRNRQTMIFSATMNEEIEHIARRFMCKPVRIEIGTHTRTVEHVQEYLLPIADHLKVKLVLRLLEDTARQRVLIFARTKRRVGWVQAALSRNDIATSSLHGDRSQAQRQRALEQFKLGKLRIIVATDVAARGLHVEHVDTVINYDLPVLPEDYVHRVGRAGHGATITTDNNANELQGEAFTFLTPIEEHYWETIAEQTGNFLIAEELDDFDYNEPKRPGRRQQPDSPGSRRRSNDNRRRMKKKKNNAGSSSGRRKHPPRGKQDNQKQHRPVKDGKLKRRHRPSRPVDRKQKPGGGVK